MSLCSTFIIRLHSASWFPSPPNEMSQAEQLQEVLVTIGGEEERDLGSICYSIDFLSLFPLSPSLLLPLHHSLFSIPHSYSSLSLPPPSPVFSCNVHFSFKTPTSSIFDHLLRTDVRRLSNVPNVLLSLSLFFSLSLLLSTHRRFLPTIFCN